MPWSGSGCMPDTTTASDIDLAVLFAEPPDATLAGPALTIEGQLERILGRPVDLLVLNSAPADVVHRVLRDGLVIFDPAPDARIRFEVAKRNEYFDLEPLRRLYRRHPRAEAPAGR